jgi:NADH-quinone oxidoreductase subunit H
MLKFIIPVEPSNEICNSLMQPIEKNELGFSFFFISVVSSLLLILNCLVTAGVFTVLERKILAGVQRRSGPITARPAGLSQFLADGGKLAPKQLVLPRYTQLFLFLLGPVLLLTFALLQWGLVPLNKFSSFSNNLEFGLLLSLMLSSLSVIAMIGASWAANSKYPFLASLRSVSLLISYELIFSFMTLIFSFLTGALSLFQISVFQDYYKVSFLFFLFPLFFCYIIIALMETNRAPFDIAEAESELGAGYNTEHSSLVFALFFLAEYLNMALMALLGCTFFVGTAYSTWLNFFFILFFMLGFILIRGIVPRYRFDHIMQIGWKQLLPVIMGFFLFVIGLFMVTPSFLVVQEVPYGIQSLQHNFFIFHPMEVFYKATNYTVGFLSSTIFYPADEKYGLVIGDDLVFPISQVWELFTERPAFLSLQPLTFTELPLYVSYYTVDVLGAYRNPLFTGQAFGAVVETYFIRRDFNTNVFCIRNLSDIYDNFLELVSETALFTSSV